MSSSSEEMQDSPTHATLALATQERFLDALTTRVFRDRFAQRGHPRPTPLRWVASVAMRVLLMGGVLKGALGCGPSAVSAERDAGSGLLADGGAATGDGGPAVEGLDGGPVVQTLDAGPVDPRSVDAGCLQMDLADGGCTALTFDRLCSVPQYTVVHTGVLLDDAASTGMGQAMASLCAPPPSGRTVNAADGGVVSRAGAPLEGRDDLLVAAGGSYTQPVVGWLQGAGRTQLLDSTSNDQASITTRSGAVLFSVPLASLGPGLDYFALELLRTTPGGPLAVLGYGFYAPGTTAAGWFFEHKVLAQQGNWPASWYVVRWSDADADLQPSAGDTYTVVASGSVQ